MSHNICQRFHLEGTFFQALRQEIGEAELNTVSGIGPYDKRLYFFIGLGDLRGKITQRPFADAFCVFFSAHTGARLDHGPRICCKQWESQLP